MEKKELLYEGKAKKLYKTDEDGVLWVEYLDQATALNGAKKDAVSGKGALNNQITSLIFDRLKDEGIPSHFIEKISKTEQLVKFVSIIPLEVVVRNTAAGSFSKRLAIPEGTSLAFPIVEFYFKEDRLDDPFINDDHVRVLSIATTEEIQEIKALAKRVNDALRTLFQKAEIRLIDFKIEVGRDTDGGILLADEISPDTCRLWDMKTQEHLDKDIYRRDLGDLVPVYQEVLQRLAD
ncbi:phosphoribosylaminoimidazolesuccinocarboxamide synthase [Candidatus Enterococcus leclercqii]|uniref:phosphoribosylaminoimidazolesuccinocarboxamide synthase n=1 Tax=Candidatus Enterococcus leclercqii TaxID=1857218 RepID=UPI00137AEAC4|nr:phosphoribosylaminoimidazolesuccinocarboxamide synthase [Enterococcus sp. CU9D]KAF1292090.1 phosphoribosylaminoimidazolesuccinocarboxamide synthase [Enterococcus sp. CU9D]